ncbi:MAG: PQQ-binding-like beta-propeller repeat protein [Acidimicrobiia bacterium]
MARRHEYVSFFGDRRGKRREFAGFEGRFGISRILLPGLAVAILGVSLWWFGFREVDADAAAIITMEDETVPTLLLPAGGDGGEFAGDASFECLETAEDWTTFQGGPGRTGCAAPTRVITDPRVLWKAEVGIQGWLNNPIIVGNSIYVSSAGVAQFVADRRDAIYSLDLRTGRQNWYYQAELDVNGIGYLDGIVVATGDEGRVWGFDARDGSLVWSNDLDTPIYSNPLTVGGMAIVGDGLGQLTAYDIHSGTPRWDEPAEVDGAIRGGASSDGERIFVAGENNEVAAFNFSGQELWRTKVAARGQSAEQTRIFAAPTIAGDLLIVTLVRLDVYAEPAVVALDRATGDIVWQAVDVAGIKTGNWANIRSSVAVAGELVLFGEAYSDSLVALDLLTGQTRWSAEVGSYCLPHWPSPLIAGDQVIMPRDDGGLYAVSLTDRTMVWEIYLGNQVNQPGGTFPAGFNDDFCEESESGYPILSSPAISDDGIIVVGTLEGWIWAIGDRSW